MYCYEGTNITVERIVNHSQTQLIDALTEFDGQKKKSI